MTDSLFYRFVKTANYYFGDEFITCVVAAGGLVSEQPYANQIIKAGLFASSPILSVGSNLYQMTKTGVSLEGMAATSVDTTIRGYALPFAARASAQMISNITGLNAELLNIPAQIGTQALYTKAKIYLVNEVTDKDGNTALIRAVTLDNAEAFNALIQAGANLNLQNKWGDTALMMAIKLRNAKAANVLIQAGAELDITNTKKRNALHLAIVDNRLDMVKHLIQAGANINFKKLNKALGYADCFRYHECTSLLENGYKKQTAFNTQRVMLDVFRTLSQNQQALDASASFCTLPRDIQTDILTWCYETKTPRSSIEPNLKKTENMLQEILLDREQEKEELLNQRASVFFC